MVGNIFTPCLLLFLTYSWSAATYVEAVASAFDVSQHNLQPMVAMSCGHFNKYLDIGSGRWMDDVTATCFSDKADVLQYCKKKFPHFEIRNIVEVDEPIFISAWCWEEDPRDCSSGLTVTPFRCLVGEFESDALVVPNLCKFSHLHQEGVCQSPTDWKVAAKANCKKRQLDLRSTGMLLPCDGQVDMYQGVEFVCCPADQPSPRPQPAAPAPPVTKNTKEQPEVETPDDPYFAETDHTEENEHLAYEEAKERLANEQRERMAQVMQQWQEAEKHYEALKSKDKKGAEKLKADMTQRFEDMVADLEVRAEQELQVLHRTHENRIESNLALHVSDQEQRYNVVINQKPIKAKRVLKTLEKYLKSIQKQRQHLISHYKHLRRTDPAKAEQLTNDLLAKLDNMDQLVGGNIELLQKLPVVYNQIKPKIDHLKNSYSDSPEDHDFLQGVQEEEEEIEEEENYDSSEDESDYEESDNSIEDAQVEDVVEDEEELPTDNAPDVTSLQNKSVIVKEVQQKNGKHSKDSSEDRSEEEEEDSSEKDIEMPTEVRTTLYIPEQDTMVPEVPIIAIKPIEKYRDDETDLGESNMFVPPNVIIQKPAAAPAHSKQESLVRSKSKIHSVDKSVRKESLSTTPVPALAFALACGIMGVITVLVIAVVVVRKKSRRIPINQGFTEIDPNLTVEQRHIVSMQQNGYENPTYKYFEMQ